MEILTVKNLSFKYPLCKDRVLENIDFAVERGSFTAICGPTGSGKTTLMRLLKKEIAPLGEKTGEILCKNENIEEMDLPRSACAIGYVSQQPEQQIVTDKVWHELAFGLENLGIPTDKIRRRVAETAAFFGIEELFERNVNELSGGQKQLLSLASVMCMQPDILLLDEPTAQLDPIAASEFIATVSKINRELSTTVIAIEHRLEELLPVADNLLVLGDGKVKTFGPVRETVSKILGDAKIVEGMPAAVRLYSALNLKAECPITVREGRAFIENTFDNKVKQLSADKKETHKDGIALEFDEVWFRYSREFPDVLKGMNLKAYQGETLCILGGNGSGKSTALSVAAGLNRAYSGKVKVLGKKINDYKGQSLYKNCVAMLPQEVQTLFLKNTVREELAGVDLTNYPFELTPLFDKHPYDLSGGEQQLVSLAKVLATAPKILLLDEPTKGLDAHNKAIFAEVISKIKASGVTIILVTHDVEFAAITADRISLMFRGEIVAEGAPKTFFDENNFYTTAANRMARGFYGEICTVEDLAELCSRNGQKNGNH